MKDISEKHHKLNIFIQSAYFLNLKFSFYFAFSSAELHDDITVHPRTLTYQHLTILQHTVEKQSLQRMKISHSGRLLLIIELKIL